MSTPNLNGAGNVGLPTFPALAAGAIFIKGFGNNSTTAATVAQYVTFGHAFQKAQLVSGGGVSVVIDGTTYPCQVDVKTSYNDGSVCLCAISHQVPAITFSGSGPTVVFGQYSAASPPGGAALTLSTALGSTTCSITLTPPASYPDWTASTGYAYNSLIKPTAGNAGGYVFQPQTPFGSNYGGTIDSGTTEPTWPQAEGGSVADGPNSLSWINIGTPISAAVAQDLVALTENSTDLWLDGPLAVQGRGVATVSGTQLRIQADVTAYADGTVNFDVLVANDVMSYLASGAGYQGGTQAYAAKIVLNGTTVYSGPQLMHCLYENWTHQAGTVPHIVNSSQEMVLQVIHNPADFIEAQAVLSYNYTAGAAYGTGDNYTPYGLAQDMLAASGFGVPFQNPSGGNASLVTAYMGNTGGRIDIGPNDAWNVWGFVTQDPTLQQVSFECSRVGGGINWHYWQANPPAAGSPGNRYVTVLDYPIMGVWGGAGDNYTGGGEGATNTGGPYYGPPGVLVQSTDMQWGIDINHHPELYYLPYLQTHRRYLLDELNAIGSVVVLAVSVTRSYNGQGRLGDLGIVEMDYQVRGTAWALRAILLATYANPDGSWWKTYHRLMLDNNFAFFNAIIAFMREIGGDFYGYYPPIGYGNTIAVWENGYMGTAVMLAAIMGYQPAIQRSAFMGNAVVGMLSQGSDSPVSGFPPAEAASYDLMAWPFWYTLGSYLGSPNYPAWGSCWMYTPPQSWAAWEQSVQEGQAVPQTRPSLQSQIVNSVFACSISGTTMTVSSVTAGTIAIGQFIWTTSADANSGVISGNGVEIVSGSGDTWTLSGSGFNGFSGVASGSFADGVRIGPGILWNAGAGSAGAYGDYSQILDYGLANLATLGYPGAAAARATLYALTDSTGAVIPVITNTQNWAGMGGPGGGPSPLYEIVPRTWNDSRVFDGAAGSSGNPTGYSFATMSPVAANAPAGSPSSRWMPSRRKRVYFGNRR